MTEKQPCLRCGRAIMSKLDGTPRKHNSPGSERPCVPGDTPVTVRGELDGRRLSDPAPTVEETTTQGGCSVPGCTCEGHGGPEHELLAIMPLEGDDVAQKADCGKCGGSYARRSNGKPWAHDCVPQKGPWFGAMYDGRCSVNECQIHEGDRIRADGEGGYECEDCGDFDDTMDRHVRASLGIEPKVDVIVDKLSSDWQAMASAAARAFLGSSPLVNPNDPVEIADRDLAAQAFLDAANSGLRPEYRVTAEEFLGKVQGTDPIKARLMTAEEFMDPAATEDVKPVMSVSGQPKKVRRDHQDRYAVVLPGETELEVYKTSGKPKGRTRVTSFVKAASSTIKLGEWKARNVVIGASRRRDLLLKADGLTHENGRDRLDQIARELEAAAGAKVGSDLGTYLHDFTEYMDASLKTWRDAPPEFQRSLALYAQRLADAGLEPIRAFIERTTIIREFGWVCGTFDRIFYHRPSGQYIIGDLKTAKTMDYGRNEIEAQLWAYAHGVNQSGIYDWNTDTWLLPRTYGDSVETGPWQVPEVSETVGVVIHMPVQGPLEGTVELLWADLENGREHAELCHRNRSQPKGKMKPWGNGPAPLKPVWEPPSWEEQFRGVRTLQEASNLYATARRDVERMELQRLVQLAQQALRELGVRG